MENTFTSVKNPLSVIAIFAGIAEISGTAVLPHIAVANQALYIWFLMLFPTLLVCIFFLTLNFNHKVLYAPSDFKDEDNFVNLLKKATDIELVKFKGGSTTANFEAETAPLSIPEIEEPTTENTDELPNSSNQQESLRDKLDEAEKEGEATQQSIQEIQSNIEKSLKEIDKLLLDIDSTKESNGAPSNLTQRKQMYAISNHISQRLNQDIQLGTAAALDELEKELGVLLDRKMKIQIGSTAYAFDGIIKRAGSLTGVEVMFERFISGSSKGESSLKALKYRFLALFNQMNLDQKKDFSLLLVLVMDDINQASMINDRLRSTLSTLPFPVAIKVFKFDDLLMKSNKT
ncbi:hypothetical protein ACO0LD_06745 [Undibacterium sp. Ji83W]|uniref:hypothetical protein n=1 Tax=Undibacterium sp. Ji83W TaxID=3413043 RepID=UPI003BEFCEE8